MKFRPILLLFFVCVLLAGCQSASQRVLPRKGEVSDFVLVEEFLRAAYRLDIANYKLQADPDYGASPGMDHRRFDETLKSGMADILSRQGDVYVWISCEDADSKDGSAQFYGFFERKSGHLKIFQNEPPVFHANQSLSIYLRGSERHDGVDLIVQWDCLFQLSKNSTVFRLRWNLPSIVD